MKNTSDIILPTVRSQWRRDPEVLLLRTGEYPFSFIHDRFNRSHSMFSNILNVSKSCPNVIKKRDSLNSACIFNARDSISSWWRRPHILLLQLRKLNTFDFIGSFYLLVTIFPGRNLLQTPRECWSPGCFLSQTITVVSAYNHNINIIDLIKIVFQCICRKYTCHSWSNPLPRSARYQPPQIFFTICPLATSSLYSNLLFRIFRLS